ncbi:hypothetical protein SAMN05421770_101382 [Granulicella rosea]|uniref:Uncharacterized protein n=1 Tax=Granulicella rosea TaxID=474952 RepID=A0A239DB87_9BACT|nr:hypothetical protein [Granulicella rosea]SNS29589.1 hypothetical protein SAMN05421770_101382 [Granulicella rosea]
MQPNSSSEATRLLRRIRRWIAVFIVGLVLSGVTAFPLVWETGLLVQWCPTWAPAAMQSWLAHVHEALVVTGERYPFLAYGTDWLAFAHLVIALVFVGPWRDPVRNKWVIQFGLLACLGVLPLALIAGPLRGIPLFWRLGDCCFGVLGALPLWLTLRWIGRLEGMTAQIEYSRKR